MNLEQLLSMAKNDKQNRLNQEKEIINEVFFNKDYLKIVQEDIPEKEQKRAIKKLIKLFQLEDLIDVIELQDILTDETQILSSKEWKKIKNSIGRNV